jgi:hypothetical protein
MAAVLCLGASALEQQPLQVPITFVAANMQTVLHPDLLCPSVGAHWHLLISWRFHRFGLTTSAALPSVTGLMVVPNALVVYKATTLSLRAPPDVSMARLFRVSSRISESMTVIGRRRVCCQCAS